MGEKQSKTLRYIIIGVAVIWLVAELKVGAELMSKTYSATQQLGKFPAQERQALVLKAITPIAGELKKVSEDLPSDAKVFMHNGLLEDYYLANYMLYPRKVLVDDPEVSVNGKRGDKVGKDLSKQKLESLGVTHLLVVSPSRDEVRVIPMEAIKRD